MSAARRIAARVFGGALLAACCFTAAQRASAAEFPLPTAEQEVFFETNIRPLLAQHCQSCHGAEEQSGGLRLDSRTALVRGGDSGAAVVPGAPDKSRLIRGVKYDDLNFQMPPEGKLTAEEIAALVAWVQQGAPWPQEDVPAEPAPHRASPAERIDELRTEHWSFQPVQKPPLPDVRNEAWVQTPIDRFVLARLEQEGLEPNPPADRRTLLRRLYFDLIGLAPSYEETEAFAADSSPDAVASAVDRLLANPHYGERWARHWLDVARYSDTMGYMGVAAETRYPYAYTYRDWVIAALNSDKPYDQFILEQIAADQLDLPEKEQQAALAGMGFLTVGRRFNKKIHDVLDDRIDVVTRGFLGLSVACARCHDHKYDPIPAADYYALYGVFASSEEPETLPLLDAGPATPQRAEFERGLAERQKKVADFLETLRQKIEAELRSRAADYLVYTARVLPQYDTGSVKQQGRSGFLRPAAIERWQIFLAARAEEERGVWRLWHDLAALPKENFAERAKEVLAAFADEANSRSTPAARRMAAALASKPLASMPVAAELFGKQLEAVDAHWQAALKANPQTTTLAEPAVEELRQEMLRAGSPLILASADTIEHRTQGERQEHTKLLKEVQAFEFSHPAAPPRAMVLVDKPEPVEPVIFRRGQPNNRGAQVPRRFLQVLAHVDGGQPFERGSGRLELARAIASDKNPLTARVLVNRVWQYHFGAGLVRTPSDFGVRGELPTHPELLDYLAATFVERGWSLKQLHREILLSAAWQQSSLDRRDALERDPENRLLWKMNRRRLEFEPLRDALLQAAGKLDLTLGGRSVNIHTGALRRGLYAFVDREDMPGLLAAFDVPNPDATTATRSETTVPQQALFLMNSPLMLQQAQALAARSANAADARSANATDARGRIERLYQFALARSPETDEIALAERFVQPEVADITAEKASSPWQFGWGEYNPQAKRLASFQPLTHFTERGWQNAAAMPDDVWQYLRVSAEGGHPGANDSRAAIRRWVAPIAGEVRIAGLLKHGNKQGNGIQGWIYSSRHGELGAWLVHDGEVATDLERVAVEPGDTLDFIVAPRNDHGWDSFLWAPVIEPLAGAADTVAARWDAAADFAAASAHAPRSPAVDPWVQLAQVLLLSNEFAFVD